MNPEVPGDVRKPLPEAKIVPRRRFSFVWIVPLLAIGFVAWLAVRYYAERGPTIIIRFREATGLEAGKSELQFRGAIIGQVADIRLSDDLQSVLVEVDLKKSAEQVARVGSEFWIVQPEVTAERIHGLGAIVSGNYIEVKPGTGKRTLRFGGLEQPPVLPHAAEGLQVALLATDLHSITRGSAVTYRGVRVGQVTSYELETNSQAVRINAHIDLAYAPLVRLNSRFWNAGGLDVDLGWLGAEIRAQSFKTLVAGGIAFATPDRFSEAAKDGTVFRLHEKADDSWQRWAPEILIPPKQHTSPELIYDAPASPQQK